MNSRFVKEKKHSINKVAACITVRTDLRAGDWSCRDCAGQVNGSTMIKPACGSCQQLLLS